MASRFYKPWDDTTFPAGHTCYFTPPEVALYGPTNIVLYQNTTLASSVALNSSVQPERSHLFDIGIDHEFLLGLTAGVDAYYKIAIEMLDDGQFAQALVLTGFNCTKGYNEGLTAKSATTTTASASITTPPGIASLRRRSHYNSTYSTPTSALILMSSSRK